MSCCCPITLLSNPSGGPMWPKQGMVMKTRVHSIASIGDMQRIREALVRNASGRDERPLYDDRWRVYEVGILKSAQQFCLSRHTTHGAPSDQVPALCTLRNPLYNAISKEDGCLRTLSIKSHDRKMDQENFVAGELLARR